MKLWFWWGWLASSDSDSASDEQLMQSESPKQLVQKRVDTKCLWALHGSKKLALRIDPSHGGFRFTSSSCFFIVKHLYMCVYVCMYVCMYVYMFVAISMYMRGWVGLCTTTWITTVLDFCWVFGGDIGFRVFE